MKTILAFLAVLPLASSLSLSLFASGCSSSDDTSDSDPEAGSSASTRDGGGEGAEASASTDASGGGGAVTCADVCTNLQNVCAEAYTSTCESDCETQGASQTALACAADATDCDSVEACQGGSPGGQDAATTADASGGGGSNICTSEGKDRVTCDCGGSMITDCAVSGNYCAVCSGLGTCSNCAVTN